MMANRFWGDFRGFPNFPRFESDFAKHEGSSYHKGPFDEFGHRRDPYYECGCQRDPHDKYGCHKDPHEHRRAGYHGRDHRKSELTIFEACKHGHVDDVKRAIRHGATVNDLNEKDRKKVPLHSASAFGNLDVVQYLLDHGAKLNITDDEWRSALCHAVFNGRPLVAVELLKRGANVNLDNKDQMTPLHAATTHSGSKGAELVEILLRFHAKVDLRDFMDRTPLHNACLYSSVEVVKLLLAAKADVNACDEDSNRPLHFASKSGKAEICEVLLHHGAEAKMENKSGLKPADVAKSSAVDVFKDLEKKKFSGKKTSLDEKTSSVAKEQSAEKTSSDKKTCSNQKTSSVEKTSSGEKTSSVEKMPSGEKTSSDEKTSSVAKEPSAEKMSSAEKKCSSQNTPASETKASDEKKCSDEKTSSVSSDENMSSVEKKSSVEKMSSSLNTPAVLKKASDEKNSLDEKMYPVEKMSSVEKTSSVGKTPSVEKTSAGDETSSGEKISSSAQNDQNLSWKKVKLIALGFLAEVHLIEDYDGKQTALKEVGIVGFHKESKKELMKQVDIMKAMHHPNIVAFIDCEITPNAVLIFMEYMPKGSVRDIIHEDGPLEEPACLKITEQVLDGLQYLHKNKVVHRDVKSDNILMDSNNNVKLSGFGVLAFPEYLMMMRGVETLHYMAPEVIKTDEYGPKADIWSLGCTIVEMLSGQPPWVNSQYKKYGDLVKAITTCNYKPEYTLPKDTSNMVEDILDHCFRDPEKRWRATQLKRLFL